MGIKSKRKIIKGNRKKSKRMGGNRRMRGGGCDIASKDWRDKKSDLPSYWVILKDGFDKDIYEDPPDDNPTLMRMEKDGWKCTEKVCRSYSSYPYAICKPKGLFTKAAKELKIAKKEKKIDDEKYKIKIERLSELRKLGATSQDTVSQDAFLDEAAKVLKKKLGRDPTDDEVEIKTKNMAKRAKKTVLNAREEIENIEDELKNARDAREKRVQDQMEGNAEWHSENRKNERLLDDASLHLSEGYGYNEEEAWKRKRYMQGEKLYPIGKCWGCSGESDFLGGDEDCSKDIWGEHACYVKGTHKIPRLDPWKEKKKAAAEKKAENKRQMARAREKATYREWERAHFAF